MLDRVMSLFDSPPWWAKPEANRCKVHSKPRDLLKKKKQYLFYPSQNFQSTYITMFIKERKNAFSNLFLCRFLHSYYLFQLAFLLFQCIQSEESSSEKLKMCSVFNIVLTYHSKTLQILDLLPRFFKDYFDRQFQEKEWPIKSELI